MLMDHKQMAMPSDEIAICVAEHRCLKVTGQGSDAFRLGLRVLCLQSAERVQGEMPPTKGPRDPSVGEDRWQQANGTRPPATLDGVALVERIHGHPRASGCGHRPHGVRALEARAAAGPVTPGRVRPQPGMTPGIGGQPNCPSIKSRGVAEGGPPSTTRSQSTLDASAAFLGRTRRYSFSACFCLRAVRREFPRGCRTCGRRPVAASVRGTSRPGCSLWEGESGRTRRSTGPAGRSRGAQSAWSDAHLESTGKSSGG